MIWTAYYYLEVSVIAQAARILGKTEDARQYARLAEEIKEAFNKKWLDRKLNQYAAGTETSNLVPLAIGLVPEANKDGVVKNVVHDIMEKYRGHLHTGDVGGTCMVDTLPEQGQGEVMYKVATATTYPGWGYMVQQGATTIWEAWGRHWPDNPREREESMIMFCFIEKFFYQDLAGIRGRPFTQRATCSPVTGRLTSSPAFLATSIVPAPRSRPSRGTVSSSWKRSGNSLSLDVAIPVNSGAKISVPKLGLQVVAVEESGKVVWRNGKYLAGPAGVTGGSESTDYITFDTGSGTYCFILRGSPQ